MKRLQRDRLPLFFIALGICLYFLSSGAPQIRDKTIGLIQAVRFLGKNNPKNYVTEQLEMENALLKAALEKKNLPAPALQHHLANVIARDPFSPHIIWIDAGSETCPFIAESSPVCIGIHALGIVEKVGEKRSKVRLLSDPSSHPSVRAARGNFSALLATHHLTALKDMFGDQVSLSALELIEKKAGALGDPKLATGYLCGLTHVDGELLFQGKGFHKERDDCDMVKKGDVLVTTGLDGLFPPGLLIARVTRVVSPEPGALSYELFASPTYPYHALFALFVLPPVAEAADF